VTVASPYRAGLGQILVEGGKPAENLDRAVAMVGRAAEAGCRVVVLPECLDFGWTDPSARERAVPIPGPHSDRLAAAAAAGRIWVVAGLVERAGDRLYNASILIDPDGKIVLHHRKINELDIGLELYSVGDRLQVAETELGTVAIPICADNYWTSRAIGHVLCRMGAQVLLSPSAWAVVPEHDEEDEPYGDDWIPAYSELASLYDATILGVSNVGLMSGGPWAGRPCIGKSLAIGPGGEILTRGPYGVDAEALTVVEIEPKPSIAAGADIADSLDARGYRGP
jgi:predicted amidohydrolase